jgi:hypothetical protein
MLAEWSVVIWWRGLTGGDPVAGGVTVGVVALFAFGLWWDNRRRSGSDDTPET